MNRRFTSEGSWKQRLWESSAKGQNLRADFIGTSRNSSVLSVLGRDLALRSLEAIFPTAGGGQITPFLKTGMGFCTAYRSIHFNTDCTVFKN